MVRRQGRSFGIAPFFIDFHQDSRIIITMKYVIVRSLCLEVARLGSEVEGHTGMVNPSEGTVVAAGFCSLEGKEDGSVRAHVWGESFAFKVKNRGRIDEEIIEKSISFRG